MSTQDLPGQARLFRDDDDGLDAVRGERRRGGKGSRPPRVRKCRGCGATDLRAGTYWVRPDLCSGCAPAREGGGR
jgi:hypothetical protein